MAKDGRPPSADIWNHPWPPKYMRGDPRPPVKRAAPPEPVPEIPIPPATRENWIAVVLAGTAGLLLVSASFFGEWGWTLLPIAPYFGLCAWAAHRVRLHPEHSRTGFLWFSTVLVQLAIHVLAAWEFLDAELGRRAPGPSGEVFLQVAGLAFVLGWIPTVFLKVYALRAGALLLVQILYPLGTLILAGILIGALD